VGSNRKHPARPRTTPGPTRQPEPLPAPEPPTARVPLALQRPTPPRPVGARAVASPVLSGLMTARPTASTRPPRAIPTPAPAAPVLTAAAGGPLQAVEFSCAPLDNAQPRSLALTYTFTAATDGAPYPVHLLLHGRRTPDQDPEADPGAEPGTVDTFTSSAWIDVVHPGSGRVSLTTRVKNIPAGTWEVTARPDPAHAGDPRVRSLPSGSATARTGFEPAMRAKAPGVRVGAWPTMVALGAVAGVALQLTLAHRAGLDVTAVLVVSLLACILGVIGAKVYAIVTEPRATRNILTAGMCIQGFVLTAITTIVLGAFAAGLPLGGLLDISIPGLLTGMAIGRLGCLLGGCCAGRPTASRWGIWATDRSLGTRRLPVQPVESAMAAVLAVVTLSVLLTVDTPGRGGVFLAGLAAYTLGRQLLFPLRSIKRRTRFGRPLVAALTVIALVVGVVLTVP
jgi:phosphatidylglycerol:prolipoprotein diacylglycerol transferase